jgi:hypothetical protein
VLGAKSAGQSTREAGSAESVSTSPLELSVFKEPRGSHDGRHGRDDVGRGVAVAPVGDRAGPRRGGTDQIPTI